MKFEIKPIFKKYISKCKKQKKSYKIKGKIISQRQLQILLFLFEGYNCTDISQMLNISKRTVEEYKQRLFDKFDVNNTVKLLGYFYGEIITDLIKRQENFRITPNTNKKRILNKETKFLKCLRSIIDNYITANGKYKSFCQWLLEQAQAESEILF